jgi:ATP-dependent Lon protease
MFPKVLISSGLPEDKLVIDDDVWPLIVRPLGFDAGIRTLERTIQGIVRKVAKKLVEGDGQAFIITTENIKEFLPQ